MWIPVTFEVNTNAVQTKVVMIQSTSVGFGFPVVIATDYDPIKL
jgi:hypothetical protein